MENEPANTLNEESTKAFYDEYQALVEKHQIDFINYPVYIPDGNGGFKTVIQSSPISLKDRAVKSPFIPEK